LGLQSTFKLKAELTELIDGKLSGKDLSRLADVQKIIPNFQGFEFPASEATIQQARDILDQLKRIKGTSNDLIINISYLPNFSNYSADALEGLFMISKKFTSLIIQ